MKIRDKQMDLWMEKKHKALKNIPDGKERVEYFQNIILPEMTKLEKKENRTWEKHRANFDVDILERGIKNENKGAIIPKRFVEACGVIDFEDIIFSKYPADIHQLTADAGLSFLLEQCTDRQKELLFYIDIHDIDGTQRAEVEGVNPRNVNAVHARTIKNIRTNILPFILLKFELERNSDLRNLAKEAFLYTTYEERCFCNEMGEKYLTNWKERYSKESALFDLKAITDYFNAEPKRKRIRKRQEKEEV